MMFVVVLLLYCFCIAIVLLLYAFVLLLYCYCIAIVLLLYCCYADVVLANFIKVVQRYSEGIGSGTGLKQHIYHWFLYTDMRRIFHF